MPSKAQIVHAARHRLGRAAFGRAQLYFRQGRVGRPERLAHHEVTAEVRGSRADPYTVVCHLSKTGVASASCDCPAGEGGRCKHVGAVLLTYASYPHRFKDRFHTPTPAAPTPEPAGPLDPGELPPHPARIPGHRLRAWAEEAGITRDLAWSVHILEDLLPRGADRAWVWNNHRWVTIGDAATTKQDHLAPPTPVAIVDAARAWLSTQAHRATSARQYALAAEAWRHTPPEDAALRRVWEDLIVHHRVWSAEYPHRATADPGTLELSLDTEEVQLVARETRDSCPSSGSHKPTITIALDPATAKGRVRCGCTSGTRTGCALRLEATARTLDLLAGRGALAAEVQETVTTPSWRRTLDRLAAQLSGAAAAEAADREGRRLGWRITSYGTEGMRIEPVLCRPYKSKPGLRTWRAGLDKVAPPQPYGLLPADTRAAQLLRAAERTWQGDDQSALHMQALEVLVGHPRVLSTAGELLDLRRSEPSLQWSPQAGGGVRIQCVVAGEARPLRDLLKGAHGDAVAWRAPGSPVMHVIPLPAATQRVLQVLGARGAEFPPEAVDALFGVQADLSRVVPVDLDPALRGEEVPGDPRPLLQLTPQPDGALAVQALVRPAPGGDRYVPGLGPELVYLRQEDGSRAFIRRDHAAERARVGATLGRLLGSGDAGGPFSLSLPPGEVALAFLEAIQRADLALQVEWTRHAIRLSRAATARDLQLRGVRKRDWLGVAGGISIDGVDVPLDDLFSAVVDGRRYVPVGRQDWVRLSDTLMKQLQITARSAWSPDRRDAPVEITPLAAPELARLAEAGAAVDLPPEWTLRLDRVRAAEGLRPEPHPGLQARLRPYQRVGFDWLVRTAHWSSGACLADDMGLGKTLQALALLMDRMDEGPALVVAPTSVGFNWLREAQRFAPALQVAMYRGKDRTQLLGGLGPRRVLITSYDLLHRDVEALEKHAFRTVVLDESQAIKNPGTRRAKAVYRLRADFVLALTGTPIENHTGELWSLFRAIAPGVLGSAERFREGFTIPIERDDNTAVRETLAALIRPFLLRRLKADVALDLPDRIESVIEVELSERERTLYEQHRLAAIAQVQASQHARSGQQRIQILAALTRLRQLACHPRLVDAASSAPSAKLTRLITLAAELHDSGHKALIFSQFTGHLALVRQALTDAGYRLLSLDGSTPARRRGALIDQFQAGEADFFLISLKAGGVGLNLTAADTVVHLDPWWNPAVEDQATDRTHRIGQTRTVNVYRLIAQSTIEERILALHTQKRELVHGLLAGAGQATRLDTAQLMQLMAGPGQVWATDGDDPAAAADPVPEPPPAPLDLRAFARDFADQMTAEVRAAHIGARTARSYIRCIDHLVDHLVEHDAEITRISDMDPWVARLLAAHRDGRVRTCRTFKTAGPSAWRRARARAED